MNASNVSTVVTLDAWIRNYELIAFPSIGTIMFVLNLYVAVNVRLLTFSPSTKLFVFVQSLNNLGGIACNSFYIPSVLAQMSYPEGQTSIWHRIPGFFAVFDIYTAMGMLLMMSVQRTVYIFWPTEAESIYDRKRSALAVLAALSVGICFSVPTAFPSGIFEYSLSVGKWLYSGVWSSMQADGAVIFMTTLTCTVAIIHTTIFVKILLIRKRTKHAVQPKGDTSAMTKYKRELRVFAQFFICTAVWMAHSIMFNTTQLAVKTRVPWLSALSETMRLCVYSVDPLVYISFNKEIRAPFLAVLERLGLRRELAVDKSQSRGSRVVQTRKGTLITTTRLKDEGVIAVDAV